MNRRIRPAILFARLGALTASLGVAAWLIVGAQRGAEAAPTTVPQYAGPAEMPDGALQSPPFLPTSKSLILVPPTPPPAMETEYLEGSKSGRVAPRLRDALRPRNTYESPRNGAR